MDCSGLSNPSYSNAGQLYLWNNPNGGGHVSSEIGDFETLVDLPYQGLPSLIQPSIVDGSDYFQHPDETSFYENTPLGVMNEFPFQIGNESQNMQSKAPGHIFGTWSGDLCDSPLSSSNGSFPTSPELHSFPQPIGQTSGYSETSFNRTVSNQNRVYTSIPPQW